MSWPDSNFSNVILVTYILFVISVRYGGIGVVLLRATKHLLLCTKEIGYISVVVEMLSLSLFYNYLQCYFQLFMFVKH